MRNVLIRRRFWSSADTLLESRGQFTDAIDAYTNALAQRPNDATIYYDRGVAYGRLNRWNEATDDYTRSIEHNGGTARAYNNRATAFAQQHNYKRAIEDFTLAIKLDPGAALSYRNRGLAYHDTNQLKEAIEDFTVAIGLEPAAFDGPFERGNAYLEGREYQKAIEDFNRAIALDASHAAAWANRSEAYRQLGNTKQAEADAAKAKQLDASIHIAAQAQAPPPAQASASAPETKLIPPEANPRREQAVRVATAYLQGKGYHVESAPPRSIWRVPRVQSDCEWKCKRRRRGNRPCNSRGSWSKRPGTAIRRRPWSSSTIGRARPHPASPTPAEQSSNSRKTGSPTSKSWCPSSMNIRGHRAPNASRLRPVEGRFSRRNSSFRCARINATGVPMLQPATVFPAIDYAAHPAFRQFTPADSAQDAAIEQSVRQIDEGSRRFTRRRRHCPSRTSSKRMNHVRACARRDWPVARAVAAQRVADRDHRRDRPCRNCARNS